VKKRPKKGTGTVGKRLNHFKTRLSTEPVPIFGLPSSQFEELVDRFENLRQAITNLDRKGHITRQGPGRVRRLLWQAAWAAIRTDRQTRHTWERTTTMGCPCGGRGFAYTLIHATVDAGNRAVRWADVQGSV